MGSEDRQRHVGGADKTGNAPARDRWEHEDVVEALLPNPPLELTALASVPDGDDPDRIVALASEGGGRVGELVDAVRVPHRPRVDGDELPVEGVFRPKRLVADVGPEELGVAEVRDEN